MPVDISTTVPVVGGDKGLWGPKELAALFLLQNAINTLEGLIASGVPGGTIGYVLPSTGIPQSDMATAVQTILTSVGGKYAKPGTGIPLGDLAAAVQTSLGKADAAAKISDTTVSSTMAYSSNKVAQLLDSLQTTVEHYTDTAVAGVTGSGGSAPAPVYAHLGGVAPASTAYPAGTVVYDLDDGFLAYRFGA